MKILTILFLPLLLFGQERVDTIYLDEFGNSCKKEQASFFIIKDDMKKDEKIWTWTQNEYYLTNQLASTCPVYYRLDTFPHSPKRHGTRKKYYKSGNLKSVINYEHGAEKGEFSYYYENGILMSKGRIENFDKIYLYNSIDSNGVDRLVNGNGSICSYDSLLNCNYYTEIKDSLQTISYYIDKELNDTVYFTIDTKLEPLKGWNRFYKRIASISAPIKKEYRGKRLLVEFIVFEDGKIGKVKNLNSVSEYLDEKLIQKLLRVGKFNIPTLQNGKTVKVALRIPFRY